MKIVVIGLGYVGLPLAIALARHFDVCGLDIDEGRVRELREGHDRTREVSNTSLTGSALRLSHEPADCGAADMFIVTVPTPIDAANRPDLSPVTGATRMLAGMIDPARAPVIVYESTVYPGVTEEICGPLIEQVSDLKRGRDFFLGYSPERINPGDREHSVDRIVKVIAGEDDTTTERMAEVYGAVTSAGVFRAASIKTAEAAKVIENAQRDINIAFMNEVTQIFARLDISIWDVLAAAKTKWNFLPFTPGLVGGHCIGVDPYYLSHRAQEIGIDPRIILSGRATNDGMAGWVADWLEPQIGARPADVLMLGVTFKENVPDLRNSKAIELLRLLEARGHRVAAHDPLVLAEEGEQAAGLPLAADALTRAYDLVIAAVGHAEYRAMPPGRLAALVRSGGLVFDLPGIWSGGAVRAAGARYASL